MVARQGRAKQAGAKRERHRSRPVRRHDGVATDGPALHPDPPPQRSALRGERPIAAAHPIAMTLSARCWPTSGAARRWVLWCLLAALPLYGFSAALVQLLGARHVHTQASQTAQTGQDAGAFDGWRDFRRAGVVADARVLAHTHAAFERHHHAQDDASVVALDARSADDGAASAGASAADGSATLVLALAGAVGLRQPAGRSLPWPHAEPATPAGRDAPPAERPPRA